MKLLKEVLVLVVCGALALTVLPVMAQEEENPSATAVEEWMRQAKKLGAKGQLPHAWWDLDSRFDEAKKNGASAQEWEDLQSEARRLVNAAAFVDEMRAQKSGMEAILGRFDQSLTEIGILSGVSLDPEMSGSDLSQDLIQKLNTENLQRQILVDSLTVTNRRFTESLGGRAAAQESLITALQVEVSSLRRQIWESELRIGVAEADRSAAESVLTQKQEREAAIEEIRSSFTVEDGGILLTPQGEVVMQVYGISFGVGSSALTGGQDALVKKIVTAVRMFPGAPVRVEGHTDNTGSNDANLRLSRRRAETVARLLEEKLGVEGNSIATEGFGPDKPIALNNTAEGRAMNRRIDVVIGGSP